MIQYSNPPKKSRRISRLDKFRRVLTSLQKLFMPRKSHPLPAIHQTLLVLLAIVTAWLATKHILYPALGIPSYAPMILRPIVGFLIAWLMLRLSSENWRQFGLIKPPSIFLLFIQGTILFFAIKLLNRQLAPLIADWLSFSRGPSIFGYIRGNTTAFLGWVAIGWSVGGFCEELLFRGFLLNKISKLFAHQSIGLAFGIIGQAVLFGLLHLYQGAFGFVFTFLSALLIGIAYLFCRRNLWPLIIAHGCWNSVAMYGIYSS